MLSKEEKLARKRVHNARYREAHRQQINAKRYAEREELAAKQRARYEAKKDQYKESMKRYRENNVEAIREYAKAYRAANSDHLNAGKRLYVFRNKDVCYARAKAWTAKNKDKKIAYTQNRRRKMAGVLSPGIVHALWAEQNGKCSYCHCDLNSSGFHLDHFYPIAMGGSNTDDNVVLACPSCNLRKGARDPHKFMSNERAIP